MDAYAIRKMVPRIAIGVIGINLSIYFCVAMIDIFRILGDGIGNLMTRPFVGSDTFDYVIGNGSAIQQVLGVGTGLAGLGIFAGLSFVAFSGISGSENRAAGLAANLGDAAMWLLIFVLIPVVLIALAVLFTLVIRQGLLVFLTIISPIAIALYILPSTEKYFRQWWDLFLKTLMVYPIISVVFAMSDILSSIIFRANTGLVGILTGIIVMVIPLLLVPFAFKLSGGVLGNVYGMASNQAGKLASRSSQGLAKWRSNENSWAGKQHARARGYREEAGLTGGNVMSGLAGVRRGIRNRDAGQGRVAGAFRGYQDASEALNAERAVKKIAELSKMDAMQPVMNNDDYLQAMRLFDTDEERLAYLTSAQGGGYTVEQARQGVASIRRADALGSRDEIRLFAAIQNAGTGTGYGGGVTEMNEALIEATNGNSVLLGNATAMARSKMQESRRFDSTPGFGTHMRLMGEQQQLMANLHNGAITQAEYDTGIERIQAEATDHALLTQGPGAAVGGRADSVRNLVPAMLRRVQHADAELQAAYDSGDETRFREAERTLNQVMASTAALHDVASQVSPENAQILADELLRQPYRQGSDGNPVTIMEHIESRRGDSDFQEMRREYQATTRQSYAQQQAMEAAARMAGGPAAGIVPPGATPPSPS